MQLQIVTALLFVGLVRATLWEGVSARRYSQCSALTHRARVDAVLQYERGQRRVLLLARRGRRTGRAVRLRLPGKRSRAVEQRVGLADSATVSGR